MNTELCPGDLVTGTRGVADVLARPAGADYWTIRLPRCCVMTIVEPPACRNEGRSLHVTVLLDGQLLEVLLIDVERLDGADR